MTMLADCGGPAIPDDAPFAFRSDRLSLDFAATRMFREPPQRARELLPRPQALADWVRAAGLLDSPPSGVGAAVLADAIAVREAIYAAACALLAGEPPDGATIALLNAHAAGRPVTVALRPDGSLVRGGSLRQAVTSLARDAVELLGGEDAGRVRRCARTGCTRLFVDRTRGRTRVWCGMRECGNRVNAAAYRRRRAGGT